MERVTGTDLHAFLYSHIAYLFNVLMLKSGDCGGKVETMEDNSKVSKVDSGIIAHIEIMQGIIERMARNSASCKNWSIMIVSALLALCFERGTFCVAKLWIGYIPVILFFLLDCYYLGKERYMIKLQRSFMDKVNSGVDISTDLFSVKMKDECAACGIIKAMLSFSTSPFYLLFILIISCLMLY